jgi:hypothetical protein
VSSELPIVSHAASLLQNTTFFVWHDMLSICILACHTHTHTPIKSVQLVIVVAVSGLRSSAAAAYLSITQ